jgi:hypothetical protein
MDPYDSDVGAHITITAKLATAVGTIAHLHPECGIRIEYREGEPEQLWHVGAIDGEPSDTWYVVNDEDGTIDCKAPDAPYAKAARVAKRLNAGEPVWAALNAEGYDADDDLVSEDASLELDDIENNVIDFCNGLLLQRHDSHVRRGRDYMPVLVNPGTWHIETH